MDASQPYAVLWKDFFLYEGGRCSGQTAVKMPRSGMTALKFESTPAHTKMYPLFYIARKSLTEVYFKNKGGKWKGKE